MKQFLFGVFVAAMCVACTEADVSELRGNMRGVPESIYVSLDDDNTRVQLNANGKTVWTEGDELTAFYHSDANNRFAFTGITGDRNGGFTIAGQGTPTTDIDEVILMYPYSDSYKLNAEKRYVDLKIPTTQRYEAGSYGVGSNLMASVDTGDSFTLKSLCGWIVVQLQGSGTVTSVTLRGNNGEQLGGDAKFYYDDFDLELLYYPDAPGDDSQVGGSLIFGDYQQTLTLECEEGVELHYTEPTEFYFVVAPQTFSQGITIEATCTGGTVLTKSSSKSLTVERNHIVPMASLTVNGEAPSNQIWYTSTDGAIIEPLRGFGNNLTDVEHFGANIVSNVYENGKGVITFDGDIESIGECTFDAYNNQDSGRLTSIAIPEGVTTIGNSAFRGCWNLESISIPNSVTAIDNFAFEDCRSLTSITIPDSVTSIGGYAFIRCSSLESITIPDSVTSIEGGAFSGCWSLTSVTIPDSVTSIGGGAFSSCWSLTSVTIPESVTTIEIGTFFGCSSLTSITIPNGVTEIEARAFEYCSSLESITIPESVTSIGNYPFADCSSLKEFKGKYASDNGRCLIIDGVLNSFAAGCGVTDYTIPDIVSQIGLYAFAGCDSLVNITIPDGVTNIANGAFSECDNLTGVYCKSTTPFTVSASSFSNRVGIYVPAEVADIYRAAEDWSIYADQIVGYDFDSGEVVPERCIYYTNGSTTEPSDINWIGAPIISHSYDEDMECWVISFDRKITAIGTDTFRYCQDLISVTLDDSITTIGEEAFTGCYNLTSITFGDSLTTIGPNAFASCTSLTDVTIPEGVTSIGYGAFYMCHSITDITIPDSVVEIGDAAFVGCLSLGEFKGKFAADNGRCLIIDGVLNSFATGCGATDYTIPEDVTSIGHYAFYYSFYLESVTIPNSVMNIGSYAFGDCRALREFKGKFAADNGRCLIIDGNLHYFALGCGVTDYIIPDGVTAIKDNAFNYCDSLVNITIPEGVTTIGRQAFWSCQNLTSVTFPDSLETIGADAFGSCDNLTNVTFGDGLTTIDPAAFAFCDSLTNIIIPDSVTTIREFAFHKCPNLTSVTLGDSVTTIETASFRFCPELISVYCKAITPPTINVSVFDDNNSNRIIYVPTESVEAYKTAPGWSDYADAIVGYDFSE